MAIIGNHMKMDLAHSLREQTRRFYTGVLNCRPMASPLPDLDLFEFENGFVMGIFFKDEKEVLTPEQYAKATWLEIKTIDPEEMKGKLLEFGINKVDYPDPTRFFFQAPGCQVFRLAPLDGGI
jgi:hypothetical protein